MHGFKIFYDSLKETVKLSVLPTSIREFLNPKLFAYMIKRQKSRYCANCYSFKLYNVHSLTFLSLSHYHPRVNLWNEWAVEIFTSSRRAV